MRGVDRAFVSHVRDYREEGIDNRRVKLADRSTRVGVIVVVFVVMWFIGSWAGALVFVALLTAVAVIERP